MEFSDPTNELVRRGAEEAGSPEALPMVVWLRGDEPWCEEFCLDAEAVMQQLGIKRSRLTQISGRELRVGRIRRGRYVSPVYRQQDVEQYADWTRATATHLKASSLLQDAVVQLDSSSDRLAKRVEDAAASVADVVHDIVARANGRTLARLEHELTELRRGQEAERMRLECLLLETNKAMLNLRVRCQAQSQLLESLVGQVSLLASEVRETAALLRILRDDTLAAQTTAMAQSLEHRDSLLTALAAKNPSPSLFSLKRLSREKHRARRPLGSGTATTAQTIGNAAGRTDHKKNPARASARRAGRRQVAKRHPSQPES